MPRRLFLPKGEGKHEKSETTQKKREKIAANIAYSYPLLPIIDKINSNPVCSFRIVSKRFTVKPSPTESNEHKMMVVMLLLD